MAWDGLMRSLGWKGTRTKQLTQDRHGSVVCGSDSCGSIYFNWDAAATTGPASAKVLQVQQQMLRAHQCQPLFNANAGYPHHKMLALPSIRAAVTRAVLPVKSSPPATRTMNSPNGSPKRPNRSF